RPPGVAETPRVAARAPGARGSKRKRMLQLPVGVSCTPVHVSAATAKSGAWSPTVVSEIGPLVAVLVLETVNSRSVAPRLMTTAPNECSLGVSVRSTSPRGGPSGTAASAGGGGAAKQRSARSSPESNPHSPSGQRAEGKTQYEAAEVG